MKNIYDDYMSTIEDVAKKRKFPLERIEFMDEDKDNILGGVNAEYRIGDKTIVIYPRIMQSFYGVDKIEYVMTHEIHHYHQSFLPDTWHLDFVSKLDKFVTKSVKLNGANLSGHLYNCWALESSEGTDDSLRFAWRETMAETAAYYGSKYITKMNSFAVIYAPLRISFSAEERAIKNILGDDYEAFSC